MRRVLSWLPIAVGVVFLSALLSLQWQRTIRGQNDFVSLYAGAKLAGTPALYSRPATDALTESLLGVPLDSTYTRPPFYAVLLKPLTLLPYRAACGVFFVLSLASILWFVARFSRVCTPLPVYAAFCIPIAVLLGDGQDTAFLLVIAAGSILLTRQKKDFLAGLLLSLCAIKFHLFLLIPLMLIIKQRWRILTGAAAGTAFLFTIGLIVNGTHSIGMYLKVLRDPLINPGAGSMPNVHGLMTNLHVTEPWEITLVCVLVLAFIWACKKTEDYEFLFALSLLCGLLISYHSGISDHVLLLLVFVLILGSSPDKPLRLATATALSPLPYAIASVSTVIPVLLLLVFVLALLSLVWRRDRPERDVRVAPSLQGAEGSYRA